MKLFSVIAALVFAFNANAQTCQDLLANYRPDTDVVEQSEIDLDVRDIDDTTDLADFVGALEVYTQGNASEILGGGLRTLKSFSSNAQATMGGRKYFEIYKKYWGSATYADDVIQAAAAGSAPFDGDVLPVVRRETFLKTVQYQSLWMLVVSKLEDAVTTCKAGNSGVGTWDEAWAFYAGSLEKDASGTGYSVYTLAEKRCGAFGTCLNGDSKVNKKLVGLFSQGQALLRVGACDDANDLIAKIVSQMTVPLVQGILRYVYRGSTNEGWSGSSTGFAKERTEGWAFAMAALPLIDQCSSSVADLVRSNLAFNADPYLAVGLTSMVREIQSTYKCLGISCADIGPMKEGEVTVIANCIDSTDDEEVPPPSAGNMAGRVSTSAFAMFVVFMVNWFASAA